MTESMIERVAKAAVNSIIEQSSGLSSTFEQGPDGKWWVTGQTGFFANEVARAAIEAMREPTGAMWLADGLVDHMHPTDAWEIMIDAALQWPPGSADRAGVPMAKD